MECHNNSHDVEHRRDSDIYSLAAILSCDSIAGDKCRRARLDTGVDINAGNLRARQGMLWIMICEMWREKGIKYDTGRCCY